MKKYNIDSNNLDEIHFGLESVYNELLEERERNIKYNYKYKRIIKLLVIGIIGIILFVAGIKTEKAELGICSFWVVGLFIFTAKSKYQNKADVIKAENRLIKIIEPDIIFESQCNDLNKLKEIYENFMYKYKNYNIYKAKNYYEYLIDGEIKVKGIEIELEKTDETGKKMRCFGGQIITIDSEIYINNRIDIFKSAEITQNFTLQSLNSSEAINKAKIELDNSLFEQKFNVYSDNIQEAYQILTTDIQQLIFDLSNYIDCEISVSMIKNKIYLIINERFIKLYSNRTKDPFDKRTIAYFCRNHKNIKEFIEELIHLLR